jgi:phosphoribosylformimino-5-aminoimidazole carboxamide ribotide isomerase
MELFCAIDLRDGGAVRLVQGDFSRERRFGDPIEIAGQLVADGAERLHVVDLDAARTGTPVNRGTVAAIVRGVDVPVQTSGGVRTEQDVSELLDLGADRVVMGTTALRQPEVARRAAERFPGQVVLGLDHRGTGTALEPAVAGWVEGSGTTVTEVLGHFADVPFAAVVATAIERDGTGAGPDLGALGTVLDLTGFPVVASGGVGGRSDLEALALLRSPGAGRCLAGVVVGSALLDGTLSVQEAVDACARSG